jgi:hypothetical protein
MRFRIDDKKRIRISDIVYIVLDETETEYLIIQTISYADGLNKQILTWTSKTNEGITEVDNGKD